MTQALTLNKSKPLIGLKGTYGLFGSDEWWENIINGVMPTLHISGVIQRAYVTGQEPSGMNNTVDLILDDDSPLSVGIYVNDENDISLFRVGARAPMNGVVFSDGMESDALAFNAGTQLYIGVAPETGHLVQA